MFRTFIDPYQRRKDMTISAVKQLVHYFSEEKSAIFDNNRKMALVQECWGDDDGHKISHEEEGAKDHN